jgi:hypothetical protein
VDKAELTGPEAAGAAFADGVLDRHAQPEAPGQGRQGASEQAASEQAADATHTDAENTNPADIMAGCSERIGDQGCEESGAENSSADGNANFPGLLRQLDELERRLSDFRRGDHHPTGARGLAAGAGAEPRDRSDTQNVPHVMGEAAGALETAIRDLTARMALASRHGTLGDRVRGSSVPSDARLEPDSGEAFSMLAVGPPKQSKPSGRHEAKARTRDGADEDQAMARIHETRLVDLVSQQVRSSFRELASRLDASFAETMGLKDMVAALGGKVEALLHGSSAERAAEDFTRELARVADRLDQADRGIMSLNSLEKTIEGLLEGFAALASPGGAAAAGLDPGSRPGLVYKEANLAREIVALRMMQEETRRRFDVALAGFAASLSRVETALGSPASVAAERQPGHLGGPPVRVPEVAPAGSKERDAKARAGEKQRGAKSREGAEMLIEPGGGSSRPGKGSLDGSESEAGVGHESFAADPAPASESEARSVTQADPAPPPQGRMVDLGKTLILRGWGRYFFLAGGLALLLALGALALAKVIQEAGLVSSSGP